MQVGYLKDALATIMFFVLSILYQSPIFIGGFIVDLLFTLNPDWHCSESTVAKYIVLLQIPVFVAIIYNSKNIYRV